MPFPGSGPGKTAPKLCNDFLLFDPLKAQPDANFLTDLPPPQGEGPQLAPSFGSCKHEYTIKKNQSCLPPLDLRPDGGTQYKAALLCKLCRIHADVQIDFGHATDPCPNSTYPLHHFQRAPTEDRQSTSRIEYVWHCSAPPCCARLTTTFRLPRIPPPAKKLLTDTGLLKKRYDEVVEDNPARDGFKQATPIDALVRLRRYVKDALNPDHTRRSFPSNNKRFMEAFGLHGNDCRELLEALGFRREDDGTMGESASWTLPNPPKIENPLLADGSSHRELLEDWEVELLALISKEAQDTGVINPTSSEGWPSAGLDVERTLAAQGYQRHSSLRRATSANEELPYFASLGIQPDFADSLVEFAFDRQADCDPEQRPYYFECLQVITDTRGGERLQVKVATLESEGSISRRDLSAAYRVLNLSPLEARQADDDRILNLFTVLQSDSGAHAQEEARQALYKIGVVRGSQRLINTSHQTIETYEDALSWLGNGVDQTTPDEGLLAVVAIKTGDSKESEELAQKAISIIAKARQSDMLNNWLLTGRSDGYQMTPDEALRYLGIDESFSKIDTTVLPAMFDSAKQDRPGEQTEKAIATLQKAMAGTVSAPHARDTWPVGLTSHGNTCYLNSLLQYYFSIAPLRDIVLNYDKYKLDTKMYGEKSERVGQRKISMIEIRGGQRFAEDLQHLFERMIRSAEEHVKPEEDLVCRAFLEPKDYDLLASTIKEEEMQKPPTLNGSANAIDDRLPDGKASAFPDTKDPRHPSDASSVTLQASESGDQPDIPMQNGDPPPTPPASPGLDGMDRKQKAVNAPPLPPRRFSTTRDEALKKAQENARQQQDVTEVHDSIMFRLRSGMMPQGKDASEEQDDALRELFKIRLVETAVKDGVDGKGKELSDASIQLNVPTEPTDIYSALDAVFDLQAYDELSGSSTLETYKSIRSLPPLLQINIPRIGFDPGHGGAYKSESCLKLEPELYLDRYTDASDPSILPTRKECWGWRRQLRTLKKEQSALQKTGIDVDGPAAVSESAKYLDSLVDVNKELESIGIDGIDVDNELSAALSSDAADQTARLAALEMEISATENLLQDQFKDSKKLAYRLAAVFFHRGSYGHGHYWIYIYDFDKDIWRSYNDERVEEFSKISEILEANDWNQGTPTYAVYVRDENKAEIVQPVCREPEKPPTPRHEAAENRMAAGQAKPMQNGDVWDDSNAPALGFDPMQTVKEGGENSWDEERTVPDGPW